jgi:6-phosphogluconolactonase
VKYKPEIVIAPDAETVASMAAQRIIDAAAAAIAARGRFTLALSGGRTPEATYAILAQANPPHAVDWSKTFLFFGDERFVPHDDARSNFAMAKRCLLTRAMIPVSNVFPIATDTESPAASAADYTRRLAEFFEVASGAQPPALDLILLGLGDDGHTASLFPGAEALAEDQAWMTWSPPGVLPPPVDRVTMTYPLINAAHGVMFLVTGANKHEPLTEILQLRAKVPDRPAAGVRPTNGDLTWIIDHAAAGG